MDCGGREVADGGTATLQHAAAQASPSASAIGQGSSAPVHPARVSSRVVKSRTVERSARVRTTHAVPVEPAAKRRLSAFQASLVVVDLVAVVLAGLLPVAVHAQVGVADIAVAFVLLPLMWVVAIAGNGGYERRFVGVGDAEFGRVFRAFLHVTVALVFVLFVADVHATRGVVVPTLALMFLLTSVGRYGARKVLHHRRRHGGPLKPVVVVGGADSVVSFAAMLRRDRYAGMQVVSACLATPVEPDSVVRAELDDLGVRVVGGVESVREAAASYDNPTVAVLSGAIGSERLRRIAWQLEGTRADLVVSPGLAELGGRRMHIHPVAGLPLLHIDEPHFTGLRRFVKTAFDVTAAGLALVVLSPLLLAVGLLVRATSPGPALFRQTRVGRNGREFTMVKFRSMVVDAEDQQHELLGSDDGNGVLFKLRSDPRVTRVGRLLRRVSLDELPQLMNVVTGSMSLVGPRPPLPAEVATYHADVRRRLLVKPGLTGLWQISGRSDLSWEESVRLDLRYVEDWSLSLDLVVLWKTARAVIKADGAY